jgi:hypothetical protein
VGRAAQAFVPPRVIIETVSPVPWPCEAWKFDVSMRISSI